VRKTAIPGIDREEKCAMAVASFDDVASGRTPLA
jgi:hypothetical protein